nr:RNA-directed DNA polymerase, eukaryota [Tanacetum cinerariifolium]
GGEESAQLSRISDLLDTVVLSNMGDHRSWDLNGDGCFRVIDVHRMLDDMLLLKSDVPSRWVKQIPIKVNVLAWKISMDRLPTRVNLHRRGVQVSPIFVLFAVRPSRIWITCCFVATWQKILLGLFVIGGAWFGTLLIRTDLGYLGLIWFSFNQVRNT